MPNAEQVIRLVSPKGIAEEKAVQIAMRFAEKLHLSSYTIKQDIDPSLLAGFVVFVGGYRYDYSAKGHIASLGQQLKENQEEVFNLKEDIKNSLAISQDFNNLDLAKLWDVTPVLLDEEELSLNLLLDQFQNQVYTKGENKLIDEVGEVISVADGIAYVSGLEHCINNELLIFSSTTYGIAMNLEPDRVGVVLLGDVRGAKQGAYCKRSGRTVSVPTGSNLLGRVVDALGKPIDGKGKITGTTLRPIESEAASVIDRQSVNQPLYTGITAIDAMTPIGRGQRELIIGDRQTGKTTIAIDTIVNQKGKNIACIYVAIGQKMSTITQLVNSLEKHGAMEYTTVVVASASDTAALQYIAPYAGCTMAEQLMYHEDRDVLIVYDDLTKHAQAYRALSLLLRRPPGREAFPGDVFYLHSRLLERSARLSPELGGKSITALPIVETQAGDISAYVPTNVISITDGQIYLETGLFFSGQRPAINVGLSVSRVGGAAQEKIMKKVAGPLRLNLAQYRELQAFAQFGSDLDKSTQDVLKKGERLAEILKQSPLDPRSMPIQVVLLYLATYSYFDELSIYDIRPFCTYFIDHLKSIHIELLNYIENSSEVDEKIHEEVVNLFNNYYEQWKQEQANATAF